MTDTGKLRATRQIGFAAAILLLAALYLAGLNWMGVVSKDEPRYADIGRAMAQSGDFVTPRLSDEPWFEKPPLLYWLEAIGFKAGLGPELAPRLPVALLSLGFVLFFWRKVRALWDERTANFAAATLATSGGWLAFSHVAVTDIPLAVMFSMAVLLALDRRIPAAAAALGFAVLAKSLVPVILFTPVLALDHRRWREWVRFFPAATFLIVTLPWHLLCFMRNGRAFTDILFLQQQFGRFFSPERQHVQPWWFYLPVLLLLLLPGFPFLALVRTHCDRKLQILLAVVIFGFVFFSASLNKLPGYLLPLLPAIAILIGAGMARARSLVLPCAITAGIAGLLPVLAALLPDALAESLPYALRHWNPEASWLLLVPIVSVAAVILARKRAVEVTFLLTAVLLISCERVVLPQIDRTTSARAVWLREHPDCIPANLDRGLRYGLNYYAAHLLPECDVLDQTRSPVVR